MVEAAPMNNRLKKIAVAAIAATALAGAVAVAQTHRAPGAIRQAFAARHLARMADRLGLTDAQREQAKAILEQSRQAAEPIRAQLQQNRDAIADAIKSGKSDAELQALSTSAGTLVGQLATIHTQSLAKAYKLLTPEQKEKAAALREEFHSRLEGWMQHRGAGL
jgi:Spy/CpxP family protein refolding chaperone